MSVPLTLASVASLVYSSYSLIHHVADKASAQGILVDHISLIKQILHDDKSQLRYDVVIHVAIAIISSGYLLGFAGVRFVRSLVDTGKQRAPPKEQKIITLEGGDCGSDDFEWYPNFSDHSCSSDKANGQLSGNVRGRVVWKSRPIDSKNKKITNESKRFDRYVNPNPADYPVREREQIKPSDLINGLKKSASDDSSKSLEEKAAISAILGSLYEANIQTEDGFWPADYGGPMFLLPGLVIACYVTGIDLGKDRKKSMREYLCNHQQVDGGWGTHIEGESTVFGTSLNYVALRLLGESATSKASTLARSWLAAHGGVVGTPQWAKAWFSVLGVFDWKGVNPVPPELWMLPDWFPFHPGKLWCHSRMVYLPISYLFGTKFVYPNAENDPVITALRQELYTHARYEEIKWSSISEIIHPLDVYAPQSTIMTIGNFLLNYTLENPIIRTLFHFPLNYIRKASIKFTADMVKAEDEHTSYIDIGPVNKALNIIVAYHAFGADSPAFLNHIPRIADYIWYAEDGMKMQGYNGSQLWDASFAAQGMLKTIECVDKSIVSLGSFDEKIRNELYKSLEKTYSFVDEAQIKENLPNRKLYYRDITAGGWGFSTSANTWPVSDCTAEGFKAIVLIEDSKFISFNDSSLPKIGDKRLQDAIDIIITMQNGDGGFPSYELNRGHAWYELLNPVQVFGDIMIDYSYVECSTAAMTAMEKFAHRYPNDSRSLHQIPRSMVRAIDYIINKQRDDGSWYGSWGVCFTYAAMFTLEGLSVGLIYCEENSNDKICFSYLTPSKKTAILTSMWDGIRFLFSKQNADGGWGESIRSCIDRVYVQNDREGSQVVQTAWALMAIVTAGETFSKTGFNLQHMQEIKSRAELAVKFLLKHQLDDGNWPQQSVAGVFNKSCSISYCNYRNSFPVWALSRFALWCQHESHHNE